MVLAGVATRPLLLHYDVFKNAGSSIDRMLEAAFGSAWIALRMSSL